MAETLTLEAIQSDPLLGQAYLQEKGKADFRFFCRDILGFKDMNKEHDALCDFLQHHPAKIKLMLMPRYTFKSSLITIGHSLWLLATDPNQRLLLYSDATEKAQGFLTGIKAHLHGLVQGSLFRAVYGAWETDPKLGVWNQGAITVAPRTTAHVEPSIETAGVETSKVGKHYSRIKFDDLVSDKNITTRELMDKVEQVYKSAGSLLQPSGRIDLAGTRWHFGDLYGRLMAEHQGDPSFAVFLRKAEADGTYFFQDIGPDSLTPAFLHAKRKSQGSALYSNLYLNEPVDAQDAVFKAQDFRFYDPHQTPNGLYITAVLDAIPPPSNDRGDDAALTVVGTSHDHNLYLLDAKAGRVSPEEQINWVFALHAQHHFRVLGLETNAFQRMFKTMVEKRMAEERTTPGFRPFAIVEFQGTTQGNKEQRIQGLQPWHERHALHLPGTRLETLAGVWSQLAYQLLQFPRSLKDDLADSLAYHLQLIQKGSTTPTVTTPPPTSAAWYEREVYLKQESARQATLPRRARTSLPQLAFS